MQTPVDQFFLSLTRALRTYAPRVTSDTSPQGEDIRILTIPNPNESRWGLQFICPAEPDAKGEIYGSLWFGAVEITGHLSSDEAEGTLRAVLDGELTAVLRYKNEDAWTNHRPAAWQRVYVTAPGDEDIARLAALKERLSRPVTPIERIRGREIGLYEFATWHSIEFIRHLPQKKPQKKERNQA